MINLGPDADSYRDPADGLIKDASSLGQTLDTFTAHRSPLGLVFDTAGVLAPEFRGHGFVLGWSAGDPNGTGVAGPFNDAGQDLLDLDLTRLGETNYEARVTRIVGGFSRPIDAEITGNHIYVLEYGGNTGLWEITLPVAPTVTTSPATDVTETKARLEGIANPNGVATDARFEWGLTTSYGAFTLLQSSGNGTMPVAQSQELSGLVPGTLYHYRIVASNAFTVVYGADGTFTTFTVAVADPPPLVTTLPATGTTTTSATLNGTVGPNGLATTGWLEWGVGTVYGQQTAPVSLGSGSAVVPLSVGLTGLIPGVLTITEWLPETAPGWCAGRTSDSGRRSSR